MRTTLTLSASLALSLLTRNAMAQRAPRACTATNPAALASAVRSVPVSSAVSNEGGMKVWMLYGTSGAGNTVSLAQVSGLDSNTLATNFYTLGEGTLSRGALAVMSGNVVAAYQRADNKIDVVLHPIAGGADKHVTFDSTQSSNTVSVAVVGNRALVGWDDNGNGLRYAWVSRDGTGSAVQSLAGAYRAPVATASFGGALIATDGDGRLGVVTATARPRFVRMNATARVTPASGTAVATNGRGVMLIAGASGRAHVSVVSAASGAGTSRELGTTLASAETGAASTPWGAYLAWIDTGLVTFLPVNTRGGSVGTSFPISSNGETARTPAVASAGNMAVVSWVVNGALKFVRVSCM